MTALASTRQAFHLTSRALVVTDQHRGARFAHDRATRRQWLLNPPAEALLRRAASSRGYRPPRVLGAHDRAALAEMRDAGLVAKQRASTGVIRSPATPLSRVFAEITAQCNLRCEHCYGEFSMARQEHLTAEQVDRLAHDAARIGVYEFDLTGGEPLLHPEFGHILEILEAHRMLTTVFTNLTHAPKSAVDAILARGVNKVITSIESADPDVHDSFRGLRGAHRRTLKNARALMDGGVPVVVNVVAGRHNVVTTPETVTFLTDRGMSVAVDLLSECGRASAGSGVSAEQAAGLRARLTELPSFVERPREHCGVGSRLLYVTAQGDLTLCPSLRAGPFRVGSVHEPYDLRRVSARLGAAGDMQCSASCPMAVLCAGGCRAEALRLSGSLSAPDPVRCDFYGVR